MLYSPDTSLNGAKLLLNKGPARKITIEDMSDALAAPTIITPHALSQFRDGDEIRGSKRKREKDRQDPRKSRRPELPVSGPGKGGRVGASATQHGVQNLVRDTTRDEDVRLFVFLSVRFFSFGTDVLPWTFHSPLCPIGRSRDDGCGSPCRCTALARRPRLIVEGTGHRLPVGVVGSGR